MVVDERMAVGSQNLLSIFALAPVWISKQVSALSLR
jgi:hypothetical protein